MAEYDEGFGDKKPTKVGRDKATCFMTVSPYIMNQSYCTRDGRDHHNFFNILITKVNYLDDIIDVFLEARKIKKAEIG